MFLGYFGHFPKTRRITWPPIGRKLVKKTGHHPLGVISDALKRVYFESSVPLRHKYTLQRAPEVTPRWWCPAFFTSLHLIVGQVIHRFGPNGQNTQNHSKMEIPYFWSFFQEVTGQLDHAVADFRKKMRPPPAGPSRRGENRTFFRDSARG